MEEWTVYQSWPFIDLNWWGNDSAIELPISDCRWPPPAVYLQPTFVFHLIYLSCFVLFSAEEEIMFS